MFINRYSYELLWISAFTVTILVCCIQYAFKKVIFWSSNLCPRETWKISKDKSILKIFASKSFEVAISLAKVSFWNSNLWLWLPKYCYKMFNDCIWAKYEPFTVVAKLATAKLKMCILILFFLIQYFSNVKISIFRFSFCLFRLQKLIMTFFMTLSIIFSSSVILLVNSKAWVTIFRSIVVKCEASKTRHRNSSSSLFHYDV